MKNMLLVSVGLLSLATPAAAQDFAGFRVEGRLGYDWISLEADYIDPLGPIQAENNEDGFVFGGEAGYDFPIGPGAIIGGYVGIDFSDSDFCQQISQVDQACLETSRNWYIGARGGAQVAAST